ncbi:hypothetical protein Tco_0427693 [Tanacetum coccineum]
MITTVQSAVKIAIQQHEQAVQKKQEEQTAFTPYWKFPIFDDDDDEGEHTILETKSDEVIKSIVEDLVPIPSESKGIFDNMCDVPFCDKNHFDAESDLLESLPNRDTSIVYSPKIDSLLEEFTGELAPINPRDFDPGIFIEIQSKRFLSPNEFSISFICDPLSSVFDTLLLFSPKNKEKVFTPGSLSSNEEKSLHLLSHRGFNPSKIISDFSKSPMMISGGDIPILDVLFLHFYPP